MVDDYQIGQYQIPDAQNFTFSAVVPEDLEEDGYTVATVAVDITGSLDDQADLLTLLLNTVVKGLRKSSRSEKIILRVILFNAHDGIKELHGFIPVDDIDLSLYDGINPKGMTNLIDAMFSAVGSTYEYAKMLKEDGYDANACVYSITDGVDNASNKEMSDVQEKMQLIKKGEELESMILILMGVKDPKYSGTSWGDEVDRALSELQAGIDITEYIDAGDVTEKNIGKIGGIVSDSISSTSQALGTGGPSQQLPSKSF